MFEGCVYVRQRLEDNFQDSVLSFHHVGSCDGTQVIRLEVFPTQPSRQPLGLYFSKQKADLDLLAAFNYYTLACILKPGFFGL